MNVIESSLRRAFGLKGEWPLKTFLFNTHMGNISVDPEVIAQYAGNVANECFGIVGMAAVNSKEGFANLLKRESMTKGINVTLNSRDKLVIDFHVIVSYGVNIMAVADNLVSSVAYRVEDFTGHCWQRCFLPEQPIWKQIKNGSMNSMYSPFPTEIQAPI